LKFLEATKALTELRGGEALPMLLAMSGTPDQLVLYLRAHAARAGLDAKIETLSFGTMAQFLRMPECRHDHELFLLLPWDFVPESNWRSATAIPISDWDAIRGRAAEFANLLSRRSQARFAYLPAPIPPIFAAYSENRRLEAEVSGLAAVLNAVQLSPSDFSLGSYLASGAPISGPNLSRIAEALVGLSLARPSSTYKVLATDADNTLWAGVVGEDGPGGVIAEPNGNGFRHFVYQGFLRRLKASGILLAVVSRNDEDMVRAPLASGRMPLDEQDFVVVRADYGMKSDHLKAISELLNLSTESIVFVDDNHIEIAQVREALPEISCQLFPADDRDLPGFFDQLARIFDRPQLTDEDLRRTEMYRSRAIPRHTPEMGSVRDYLIDLQMELTIHARTVANLARALQLINKTNQFTLNGVRLTQEQLEGILDEGGRLYSASLADRAGSHGEILVCLIDSRGKVVAFVMSCRVFQRRVEFAFLAWLLSKWNGPSVYFEFVATDRNSPFRDFLADPAFAMVDGKWNIDVDRFVMEHSSDSSLFLVQEDL
jgi:FkbH-like protein